MSMPDRFYIKTEGYPYFVTCTIVEWLPLFREQAYAQIILESLEYLRQKKNTQVNAFVIMPAHFHAVLWPQAEKRISDVLRDFKRFTSKSISRLGLERSHAHYIAKFITARQENRAQDVSSYQVWQEGSHPEILYTPGFAKQKLDYIHLNPVRAGLVETIDQWPYSSAKAYLLEEQTFPTVDLLEIKD